MEKQTTQSQPTHKSTERPSIWMTLPRHRRPIFLKKKKRDQIDDPGVLLECKLYGYLLAGLVWRRILTPPWVSRKGSTAPMWARMRRKSGSTSRSGHLGMHSKSSCSRGRNDQDAQRNVSTCHTVKCDTAETHTRPTLQLRVHLSHEKRKTPSGQETDPSFTQ